jgi:aminopeptidase N
MAVEKLEVEQQRMISKGYYLSKKRVTLISIVFVIAIVGLIAGISVIASSESSSKSKIEKLEAMVASLESMTVPTTSATMTTSTTITTTTQKLDYRLPTDLVPSHYDVKVSFQFVTISYNSFPYDGEVTIDISCAKTTSKLVLHINKIDIDNSSLTLTGISDTSFGELKDFRWYNDFTREFFIADLTKQLKADQTYRLFMKYTGYLQDDLRGFYRSSYIRNNNTVWLMTSQLESTDGRKSFPCFDEPAMKATFKIRTIHQSNYTAMSNMPVENIIQL